MRPTAKIFISSTVILWLLVLVGIFFSTSRCASYQKQLAKIPQASCESFEYHRGGNFSSADIVATGISKEGNVLKIQSVSFVENWGPFFNTHVTIKGYSRTLSDAIGGVK